MRVRLGTTERLLAGRCRALSDLSGHILRLRIIFDTFINSEELGLVNVETIEVLGRFV